LIAEALRYRISPGSHVEIYSSDLRRTRQTADAIGDLLGVPVIREPGLREKSYGEAEGRPQAWLDERFAPPPATGNRIHHDEGIPGAETRWTFGTRVYAAMDRILASEREHQVV
jgi:probable phosphoglycerate mutase